MRDEDRDKPELIAELRELRARLEDRKKIEDELLNAKKLEAIGVLAGGIAHDFNNLLFVILGNVNMAQMRLREGDPALRHLTDAEKACLRAKDLTQKFITFASGSGPIKSRVAVRELVSNLLTLLLSRSNVKAAVDMPEGLWTADVDEGQIRQALSGIISNAREAMPRGGTMRVSAVNYVVGEEERDVLGLAEGGEFLKLTISDDGVGIAENHLGSVFDPYFSTKYRGSQKGMGFGLAIAHSVIKRHKGSISVESRQREGTTVTIFLPATAEKHMPEAARPGYRPVSRKRVLAMDDEPLLNELIRTMLEHLGYEVDAATDGERAVELFAEARNAGRSYDAVILDLTVKGGMGGRETIQKLMALDPKVRAVVSSGHSADPIMSDFHEYGFMDKLKKPYALEELRTVMKNVLAV
ncbi:MAG: response regulator [Desulfobacteraceae bacterium]|nr:response regulator [Desulfobacteraceae bacterium]